METRFCQRSSRKPLISLEDFIPLAVKAGADIHAYDDYALRVASYYGHAAAVECLLKAGAKVTR